MIAADASHGAGHPTELQFEPLVAEHDHGLHDPQVRAVRQLDADHLGAECELDAALDARVQRGVTPVECRLACELGCRHAVCGDRRGERSTAERVIPVPVGQHGEAQRRQAERLELAQEAARVRDRRAHVEQDRGIGPRDSGEGRTRWHRAARP